VQERWEPSRIQSLKQCLTAPTCPRGLEQRIKNGERCELLDDTFKMETPPLDVIVPGTSQARQGFRPQTTSLISHHAKLGWRCTTNRRRTKRETNTPMPKSGEISHTTGLLLLGSARNWKGGCWRVRNGIVLHQHKGL
jgi:hypothetical protein